MQGCAVAGSVVPPRSRVGTLTQKLEGKRRVRGQAADAKAKELSVSRCAIAGSPGGRL